MLKKKKMKKAVLTTVSAISYFDSSSQELSEDFQQHFPDIYALSKFLFHLEDAK